jgi:hypothetical protein
MNYINLAHNLQRNEIMQIFSQDYHIQNEMQNRKSGI